MLCKNAELFLEEAKRRGIEGIEVEEVENNLQRAVFYQDLDNGIEMRNMVIFDSKNDIVVVSGMDKQQVGMIAANIRDFRRPEPYLGKGIKYSDERIRRKAGKAGK